MKSLFADRSILYEKTAIKAFNLRLPFLKCCKMQHLFDVASVQKGNSLVFNVSVLVGAIRIPNSRFEETFFTRKVWFSNPHWLVSIVTIVTHTDWSIGILTPDRERHLVENKKSRFDSNIWLCR
jgi:uncharacterized membrane protein